MAISIQIPKPQPKPRIAIQIPKPQPKPKVAISVPKPQPKPAASMPQPGPSKAVVSAALKFPKAAAAQIAKSPNLAMALEKHAKRGSQGAKVMLTAAGIHVAEGIKAKVQSLAGKAIMGDPGASKVSEAILSTALQAGPTASPQTAMAAEMLSDAIQSGDVPREAVLPSSASSDYGAAPAPGPAPDFSAYEGDEDEDDGDDFLGDGEEEEEDSELEEEEEEVSGVGAMRITLRSALIDKIRRRIRTKHLTTGELVKHMRQIRLAFNIKSRGGAVGCC